MTDGPTTLRQSRDRPHRPTRPFHDSTYPHALAGAAWTRRARTLAAVPLDLRERAGAYHGGNVGAILECDACAAVLADYWMQASGGAR